jgi:hypothetical protein
MLVFGGVRNTKCVKVKKFRHLRSYYTCLWVDNNIIIEHKHRPTYSRFGSWKLPRRNELTGAGSPGAWMHAKDIEPAPRTSGLFSERRAVFHLLPTRFVHLFTSNTNCFVSRIFTLVLHRKLERNWLYFDDINCYIFEHWQLFMVGISTTKKMFCLLFLIFCLNMKITIQILGDTATSM